MWLLKTHFGEKRLADNYMPLSCLIGGREEVFKILIQDERSGPRRVWGVSECVCVSVWCVYGGYEKGFREEPDIRKDRGREGEF